MKHRKLGPAHDPDDVLSQLAPKEADDERELAHAAEMAGLTVEQLRRAAVALEHVGVTHRIAWRERIRMAKRQVGT